jgi:hypothetical protein
MFVNNASPAFKYPISLNSPKNFYLIVLSKLNGDNEIIDY